MRRRALAMLLDQGLTQEEAAAELGVSPATISSDVAAIKRSLEAAAAVDVARKVAREAGALDADEAALRALVAEARTPSAIKSMYEAVLSIMRRRADLLGLDAPARRRQAELEGEGDDLDALLARVLRDMDG